MRKSNQKFIQTVRRITSRQTDRNNTEVLEQVANAKRITDLPLDLQKKIRNRSIKNSVPEKKIWDLMRRSELYAIEFAKSATRQNPYEKLQLKSITGQLKAEGYQLLGKLGTGSRVYIEDGIIAESKGKGESTSIDLPINYRGVDIFATLKWADDIGGSQNNGKADVINTLIELSNLSVHEGLGVAVLNGPYYTDDVIDTLKERFSDSDNIVITDAYSFKADVGKKINSLKRRGLL